MRTLDKASVVNCFAWQLGKMQGSERVNASASHTQLALVELPRCVWWACIAEWVSGVFNWGFFDLEQKSGFPSAPSAKS